MLISIIFGWGLCLAKLLAPPDFRIFNSCTGGADEPYTCIVHLHVVPCAEWSPISRTGILKSTFKSVGKNKRTLLLKWFNVAIQDVTLWNATQYVSCSHSRGLRRRHSAFDLPSHCPLLMYLWYFRVIKISILYAYYLY